VLKSVCYGQQVAQSVRHYTYLNIANPEHGIGGLDGLLDTLVGAGTSVKSTEVWNCFVNTALAHVSVEGRKPGQLGELLTLVLEVVADGESIDDDDRILALLHHLAKLAHDFLLELWIVWAQRSRYGDLEC